MKTARKSFVMDIKKTTPGPWRWDDWSTPFGATEDPDRRTVLEAGNGDAPDPVVYRREGDSTDVARLEWPVQNSHDRELIRRAPERAAALAEMFEMFGGNMGSEDCARYRALAGVVR